MGKRKYAVVSRSSMDGGLLVRVVEAADETEISPQGSLAIKEVEEGKEWALAVEMDTGNDGELPIEILFADGADPLEAAMLDANVLNSGATVEERRKNMADYDDIDDLIDNFRQGGCDLAYARIE
jgi:hypothetical protein